MFAARLARLPLTAFVTGIGVKSAQIGPSQQTWVCQVKKLANQARARPFRKTKSKSLKETILAPAGEGAFTIGKGVVAGSSALGIGALCYYGLGLSNQVGAVDRAGLWPQVVRDRVRSTYMYFGGSIAMTAASALAVARNAKLMRMMMSNSLLAIGATFAAVIGSGMVVRSIPYKEGLGVKQLAWLGHAGIMGAVVAPLAMLGGPILVRAAWYTAGVVMGLSTLAMCAPSDKFLNMGAPLTMGLGVVFVSSIGSMFLKPTSMLGAGLYSMSLYGGLVIFSLFLLYDTQRILHQAENHPVYAMQPYDPVNMSIGIYLDTLNIFIRLAIIMAGGGGRRK